MDKISNGKTLVAVDFHGNKFEVPVEKLRWRPSTYAIVIHKSKILLTRQLSTYNLPGGGMEFGEMPEEAVVRETFEETGIKVANPRLVACKSEIFKKPRSDDVEDFFQSVQLFYQCDYKSGEFSLSGLSKHEQSWTELPEWVAISKFGSIKYGGNSNWQEIVRKVTSSA